MGRALDLGVPAVELDVHATADRALVVCHDATLERTTGLAAEIRSLPLSEVMELDNSYFFEDAEGGFPFRGRAPSDRSFGVATLDEVLEAFPDVILNLDIKQTAPQVEPYEELLADTLRAHGRTDDVIVASFDDRATEAFSRYAPEIPTSAGTSATVAFFQSVRDGGEAPEAVRKHVALQVPASFKNTTVVDEAFVEAAHSAGLAVHVWTVNDPREMEELVGLGVDGIMTDVPSVLMGLLDKMGAAWRP